MVIGHHFTGVVLGNLYLRLLCTNVLCDYVYITSTRVYTCTCVHMCLWQTESNVHRGDNNSLTSDIFRSFWLPLMHCLSNAMYGCPTRLCNNMALWLLMALGQ